MKKNIEMEKFRFVGGAQNNEAVCIKNDGTMMNCTQTVIIEALAKSKKYIKGGKKIDFGENSGVVSYLIDYGSKDDNPKEMIKITFDKKYLLDGDVNALAIDSICKNAITIKNNNVKKKILKGTALVLVSAAMVGTMVAGFSYAASKETEYQTKKTEEYISKLNQERFKNGLGPIGENSNISYDDEDFDLTYEASNKSR